MPLVRPHMSRETLQWLARRFVDQTSANQLHSWEAPFLVLADLAHESRKPRYKLRRDLIEVVEWDLNRDPPYRTPPRLCAQLSQLCFRQAEGAQPFSVMCERGRHAVEH